MRRIIGNVLAVFAAVVVGVVIVGSAKPVLAKAVAALVQDVDSPARRAYQVQLSVPGAGQATFVVPATTATGEPVERMAIEFVSAGCETNSISFMKIDTQVHATVVSHWFSRTVSNWGQITSQPTRIYADARSVVLVDTFSSVCTVGISGFLVTQ